MQLIHAVYEPRGEGPHPAIIALHGWGANGLDLLGLAPYLCGGRFLTLCPQGPLQTPIGPGAVGYGWFPLSLGDPPNVGAILAASEQLRAFLDVALARYPIDTRKLIVLGFSQGGVMAHSLALQEPQRFAAAVVLSSWLPHELAERLARPGVDSYPPMLVQHGSRDELIGVSRARESIEALRQLRVPVTYREYDIGHEISPRSLAELSSWLEEKILSPLVVSG